MRVKFKMLKAGHCHHLENIAIRTGRFRICEFPSLFGLIIHPGVGLILYDTGYSTTFYEHTRYFPENLYKAIIPVHCRDEDTAASQITRLGYQIQDVKLIVISHFHADHISGLRDFPNARFVCSRAAYHAVKDIGRYRATLHGFIRGLLPPDFLLRSSFVEDYPRVSLDSTLTPFQFGFNILGDRSLLAVDLPGHVAGQIGLSLQDDSGAGIFLVGDACWSSRSYKELILPSPLARIAITNWHEYQHTLGMLHKLHHRNPDMLLIPSHCEQAGIVAAEKFQ